MLTTPVESRSQLQAMSIITSLLTTAWVLTLADYNMDLSEFYRQYEPTLYGAYNMASKSQTVKLFLSVLMFIGSVNVGRSACCGLLAAVYPNGLMLWLLCEMGLFVTVRSCERSWRIYTGSPTVISLILMTMEYVCATCAPMPWLRIPVLTEPHVWIGAALYTLLANVGMVIVAYNHNVDITYPHLPNMKTAITYVVAVGLMALTSLVALVRCACKDVRKSYYSLNTPANHARTLWHREDYSDIASGLDATRSSIMITFHPVYWPPSGILYDWLDHVVEVVGDAIENNKDLPVWFNEEFREILEDEVEHPPIADLMDNFKQHISRSAAEVDNTLDIEGPPLRNTSSTETKCTRNAWT